MTSKNTAANPGVGTESTPQLPSYQQVADVLQFAQSYVVPSELHGILTGFACRGELQPDPAWIQLLLAETPPKLLDHCRLFIQQLFAFSVQELMQQDCRFALLLPKSMEQISDASDAEQQKSLLTEQLIALSQWCEGFMLAIRFGQRHGTKHKYSTDLVEALEDLDAIAQLSLQISDKDQAISEPIVLDCVEHVRVAVMLIHAELSMKLIQSQRKH